MLNPKKKISFLRTMVGATANDQCILRCKNRDRNPSSNINECFRRHWGSPVTAIAAAAAKSIEVETRQPTVLAKNHA